MKVKGSSNEQYILESAKKLVCNGYTDYQVIGGAYVARIFDWNLRKKNVEAVLCQAVYEGTAYGDEKPLNVLYSHGRFCGFLYEGVLPEVSTMNTGHTGHLHETSGVSSVIRGGTPVNNGMSSVVQGGTPVNNGISGVAVQIAVAVVMGITALFGVFPFLEGYVIDNAGSGVVQMLYYLDYMGIPALITGLVLQIIVLRKIKDIVSNLVLCGVLALVSNLLGSIAWTVFVMMLMALVQGVVSFLMKYLVVIILIVIGFIWLKSKFSK